MTASVELDPGEVDAGDVGVHTLRQHHHLLADVRGAAADASRVAAVLDVLLVARRLLRDAG